MTREPKLPITTLTDRETNLFILYKKLASEPQIRNQFCNDWAYIAGFLFEGEEDAIPDVVLDMIMVWLDAF